MIVRINPQNFPALLVLRRQFLSARFPQEPVTEQQVQTLPHPQATAILHTAGGYCIFHPTDWQGQTVLWADELYLQPQSRKQGNLQEFADWLRNYCEYNGIAVVMGMAFSLEEALPLKNHLQAKPVAQILRVAVSDLFYRPTEQTNPTAPSDRQAEFLPPKPKRERKPRVKQVATNEEDSVEFIADTAIRGSNGATLTHKSGVALPLPLSPENM